MFRFWGQKATTIHSQSTIEFGNSWTKEEFDAVFGELALKTYLNSAAFDVSFINLLCGTGTDLGERNWDKELFPNSTPQEEPRTEEHELRGIIVNPPFDQLLFLTSLSIACGDEAVHFSGKTFNDKEFVGYFTLNLHHMDYLYQDEETLLREHLRTGLGTLGTKMADPILRQLHHDGTKAPAHSLWSDETEARLQYENIRRQGSPENEAGLPIIDFHLFPRFTWVRDFVWEQAGIAQHTSKKRQIPTIHFKRPKIHAPVWPAWGDFKVDASYTTKKFPIQDVSVRRSISLLDEFLAERKR